MAKRTNAFALYDAQVRKFEAATVAAEKAWEMLPEGAEADARENTSGNVSEKELRRRGHPFARIGGRAAAYNPKNPARSQARRKSKGSTPVLPINRQRGKLQESIERKAASVPGMLASQHVGFNKGRAGRSLWVLSPEGTRRMVARTYWADIRQRWRTRNRAFRDVFVRGQRSAMGG